MELQDLFFIVSFIEETLTKFSIREKYQTLIDKLEQARNNYDADIKNQLTEAKIDLQSAQLTVDFTGWGTSKKIRSR